MNFKNLVYVTPILLLLSACGTSKVQGIPTYNVTATTKSVTASPIPIRPLPTLPVKPTLRASKAIPYTPPKTVPPTTYKPVYEAPKTSKPTVIQPTQSAVSRDATRPPANGSMWDKIAQCESGGNWHINSGNGYFGGVQFDTRTWLSAGGGQFAPRADLATKEQQIIIANRVYAKRGLQPWGCGWAASK